MMIKNSKELGSTELRRQALAVIEAGLAAASPAEAIRKNVLLSGSELVVTGTRMDISGINRLIVVAVGKCALSAAQSLEEVLGDRLAGGLVLDVRPGELKKLKLILGDHPYPSEKNRAATREIIRMVSGLNINDLVLFVISGGGSALLCNPQGITVEDEVELVRELFRAGANIVELNTIRKHLSLARGGFLAKHAHPAKGISLIFSDVPGDDLGFISSGPTVRDETSVADAQKILKKYGLHLPSTGLIETPKEEKYFENVKNILIASNRLSLEAMLAKGRELGLRPEIINPNIEGEARVLGDGIARKLHTAPPGTLYLYGGETTVTIGGGGQGGRNQELALGALSEIEKNELIASVASDGRDNTAYAGAICDIITKEKSVVHNLNPQDYLARNDSYNFFRATKDFLDTGPTGGNVSDLIIAIKK